MFPTTVEVPNCHWAEITVPKRDYEAFVEMDSDFSHDPAALPSLVAPLADGAELVIGSRYIPEGTTRSFAKSPGDPEQVESSVGLTSQLAGCSCDC